MMCIMPSTLLAWFELGHGGPIQKRANVAFFWAGIEMGILNPLTYYHLELREVKIYITSLRRHDALEMECCRL